MKAIAAINQIQELVKLALENTDIQIKGTPRSVRLPDDLDTKVNKAMEILGCDRTEIVVACVERNLDAVIAEIIKKRTDDAQSWLRGSENPAIPGRPPIPRATAQKSQRGGDVKKPNRDNTK